MKSIRMRNGFCYDEVYYTSLKRGRRIMVITQASQAVDRVAPHETREMRGREIPSSEWCFAKQGKRFQFL